MVRCIDCKKLKQCCENIYICEFDQFTMDPEFIIHDNGICEAYVPLDANNSEE